MWNDIVKNFPLLFINYKYHTSSDYLLLVCIPVLLWFLTEAPPIDDEDNNAPDGPPVELADAPDELEMSPLESARSSCDQSTTTGDEDDAPMAPYRLDFQTITNWSDPPDAKKCLWVEVRYRLWIWVII